VNSRCWTVGYPFPPTHTAATPMAAIPKPATSDACSPCPFPTGSEVIRTSHRVPSKASSVQPRVTSATPSHRSIEAQRYLARSCGGVSYQRLELGSRTLRPSEASCWLLVSIRKQVFRASPPLSAVWCAPALPRQGEVPGLPEGERAQAGNAASLRDTCRVGEA
jgi:hypothetical protein